VTEARVRLWQLSRLAGYSREVLDLVADATLTGFVRGTILGEAEILAVCLAVETCAQAGLDEDRLREALTVHRLRFGERWRADFWRSQLRIASLRFNNPHIYGTSPCDALDLTGPTEVAPASSSRLADVPDIHPAVAAAPLLADLRAA
jgi:hypothetical protein